MANKINLKAQKRELKGRKLKKLRAANLVPANVYGTKIKSLAIKLPLLDFKNIYKEAGETSVIDLVVESEKESRPVLISDIQVDPVKKQVLHVDFRQVDLTKKISANVPVEVIGESSAVEKGAILVTLKDDVEVEALPNDIPEKFELDISTLKEVGDTITVADVKVNKDKVEIKLEAEEILVHIQEPTQEEPEPTAEEEATEDGGVEASEEKSEESTSDNLEDKK